MLDKETYKKELIRMWDSLRDDEYYKGYDNCAGVICEKCPLHGFDYGCSCSLSTVEIYNAVEKWSKEHPKPKYKVSQLEYDILRIAIDYSIKDTIFDDFYMLTELLEKGYFKGTTLETNVRDYFDNCEVEDDNEKNNNGGNDCDRNQEKNFRR